MRLIHRLEPLWWILFGAGGFATALFLPALFLCVALLFPLGVFGDSIATFQRMRTLFANPVGKLVLAAVLSLAFWHAAHHTRHLALDLGFEKTEAGVSYLVYGAALLGTLLAFGIVAAI
jgi:fumarate reductase subunit D